MGSRLPVDPINRINKEAEMTRTLGTVTSTSGRSLPSLDRPAHQVKIIAHGEVSHPNRIINGERLAQVGLRQPEDSKGECGVRESVVPKYA